MRYEKVFCKILTGTTSITRDAINIASFEKTCPSGVGAPDITRQVSNICFAPNNDDSKSVEVDWWHVRAANICATNESAIEPKLQYAHSFWDGVFRYKMATRMSQTMSPHVSRAPKIMRAARPHRANFFSKCTCP